ncbi:MAG: hypothetical protein KGJ62_05420 [Armatimonadetes bacterium]|nr:hypothetical protein [Armatimonadota bacterium]
MLVAVDPPVVGQPYGMGGEDIASVILSPRFEGSSLFPVTEWPCHVYVARILNESVTRTLFVGPDDVEMMAWATIYRVQEEAEAHCITTR